MRRTVILIMLGLLAVACAQPAEFAADPVTTTTTAPGTTTSLPPELQPVSTTACASADPWSSVETAFEGVVTGVETRPNPDRAQLLAEMGETGETEDWIWVSFEVERWFTNDYGTSFSMWAPSFEGAVGESWLIAGALYYVDQQSGEIFGCVSSPVDNEALVGWVERYGEGVVAGSETAEDPADPEVIAQIEAARATWEAAGIDDYTAVIMFHDGRDGYSDDCGHNTSVRVVVENGEITQAIDVGRFCMIEDFSELYLIDDLFDLAAAYAGAFLEPLALDQRYGFPTYFYASDRSVDVGAAVQMFEPRVLPAVNGAAEATAEAVAARTRWEAAGIADYSFDLQVTCFCTISGTFHVVVEAGEPVEVTSESAPVDITGFDFLEFTIDGVFDLIGDWGGDGGPDEVVAAFDPESGHPLDISIDHIRMAVDDELAVTVTNFTPAG